MRRSLWAVVFVFAMVLPAHAADEVARCTKSSGGTAFQSGEVIKASEVNCDFDSIVSKINGNIDTGNLADLSVTSAKLAAGAFDLVNIDDTSADIEEVTDHCANEVSCNKEVDRNASGSPTGLATNAEQEIKQIRRQLRRQAIGESAVLADGDTASDDYKFGAWFDRPARGPNLLVNGDFELKTTASTACPDGWTDILGGGAPAFTQVDQAVADGDGKFLRVNADTAAEQGCSQTLTSLKASTHYLVVSRVKDTFGTCKVETTGADATTDFVNMDRSITGAAWETVSGIVSTDSTPAALVVKLVTNDGATDDCDYDHVGVYEMNQDPIPTARRVVGYVTSTETGAAGCAISSGPAVTTLKADNADACDTDLSISITVPSPGCIIEVDAVAAFTTSVGGSSGDSVSAQIEEDGTPVGVAAGASADQTNAASVPLSYVKSDAIVGTTHAYTIGAWADSGNIDQGGQVDSAVDLGTSLKVVMECGG